MGLDIFFTKKKSKQIGYFRKVNFLVRFFKDKGYDVANQIDFEINKEMCKELLDRCEQVLNDNSKAEELLPTMGGFFFGSTDYDEYYFGDVGIVRDYINNVLLPEFDKLGDNEYITFGTWY